MRAQLLRTGRLVRGTAGLVDIDVAAKFAARFASGGPLDRSYLMEGLDRHLEALTAEAYPLVARETGFVVDSPPVARVLSRHEWATANIESMVGLMSPLLDRIEEKLAANPAGDLARLAYRPMLGVQLGTILGFLSHRVLGQYDVLVASADEVWFVGTNIVLMERRMGFVPRDFRLWVVLHEVTHRAQFQGNPWLRDHFLELVQDLFDSVQLDPRSFLDRVVETIRSPESDLPVAILGPQHREKFDRLQAFMSVIEGHGNFVMDRLADGLIPTQPRMKRTLQSRASANGPMAKLFRRLLGLELKRQQYEQGERFFIAVHAAGGPEAVRKVFSSPQTLPTLEEIQDSSRWLARI